MSKVKQRSEPKSLWLCTLYFLLLASSACLRMLKERTSTVILGDVLIMVLLFRRKAMHAQRVKWRPKGTQPLLMRSNPQTPGFRQSSSCHLPRARFWHVAVLNFYDLLQTGCWVHSRELQGKFTLLEGTAGRCPVNSALAAHPSFMVGLPLASVGSEEAVWHGVSK